MTQAANHLTAEIQAAILASIKLDRIESFDDEHDPEEYSTNIYVDVTIDGHTYTVVHQRGTDGEVEQAPFADSGMPEVNSALEELAGGYVDDMFEVSLNDRIAQVAQAAQDEYDTNRDADLVVTSEFGVDAHGNVCDVDSDEAVLQFEHSNEKFANLLRFEVSEKNADGRWEDSGDFDCFHFHLDPAEAYRRYAARQAAREEELALA